MSPPKPRFTYKETKEKSSNKFAIGKVGYYEKYPEFSFRYYDDNHKHYSVKCIVQIKDFYEAFNRFKSLSSLKWKDIAQSGSYHFHDIEWNETTEPKGFNNLPSVLRGYPACQFKLFKECRIIGFFNENNIFEIVWIDRNHQMYKKKC